MTETAHEVLARIVASFSDARTQYCRLELSGVDAGRYRLTGAVLNRATLAAVLERMAAAFPGFTGEAAGVRVLDENAVRMAVGVNLTGLYAQPSWLAEQVSQLLNGLPLDALLEEGKWRLVRQLDGYLGWAYGPYLTAAAERAFRAGFDACEINHATAHQGNTFLSRIWNKRDDEYGPQSYENRTRFIRSIMS